MGLVITISDLHLGQPFNLGAFKDFLADLRKRVHPDTLVLAGDILELAWMRWEDLKVQKLAMDALDELKAFATGTITVLIPGNHDPNKKLDNLVEALSPIRRAGYLPEWRGEALELDRVVYTHGHQFDSTTRFWDRLLRLPIKTLLPPLYIKLYGSPYEVKRAQREDYYNELIWWVTGRAIQSAQKQNKGLVFGHTHFPVRIDLGNSLTVANCGDLRDSWSYTEAKDGQVALKFWRP